MSFGIALYRKNQQELLKLKATGSENIKDTYKEWEKQTSLTIKEFKRKGHVLEKVDFNVIQFNQQCREENKNRILKVDLNILHIY